MSQVWHSSLDGLFPPQAHSSDVQPHSPKNNLESYNFNVIIDIFKIILDKPEKFLAHLIQQPIRMSY